MSRKPTSLPMMANQVPVADLPLFGPSERWDNGTRRRMLAERAKAAKAKRERQRKHAKREKARRKKS